MTFRDWWLKLQECAFRADWPLGEPESYSEYYEDGDTPEDALATEISYADDMEECSDHDLN